MKRNLVLLILTGLISVMSYGCGENTGNSSAISNEKVVSAAAVLAEKGQIISTFSTEYNEKNENRVNNIKIAANTINGIVVNPGEVFSYNDTLGSTSKEQGYKLSKVFRKGKLSKGYGGGVCQVSSTLFNAAEGAGMEIVERHPHSREVKYIEKGRDAATSIKGKLDFKFKNILEVPIVINASAENGTLTVSISKL